MQFTNKFRRDCTNNTASENKIDQILSEFEQVKCLFLLIYLHFCLFYI